jgi:hypothetical protein
MAYEEQKAILIDGVTIASSAQETSDSGSSTLDVWRSGAPFVPAKYIDTRDFSAWRAGSPFIRWIDDLPPQVSRNPALRKVRTFRHGPKIVVIGG